MPWLFGNTRNRIENIKQERTAKLHDPELPRNPELNLYNPANAIDLDLSYGQLNTYYTVMRCLIKQKDFLPKDDKPYKHQGGFSKRALLETSQDSQLCDKTIQLHLSKAKAITIKRTLALVEKLGMDNSDELYKAASEEYQRYCLGK